MLSSIFCKHCPQCMIKCFITRNLHTTIHYRTSLNVTKLLDDIQNTKINVKIKKKPKTLEKLLKNNLEKKIKKKSNYTAINVSNDENVFVENEPTTEKSLDLFEELGLTNVDQLIESESFDYRTIDDNYEMYENSFMAKKNLLSYIHLCLYNDQLSEAHSFLQKFLHKFPSILSSNDVATCCEVIIKGMAQKGNTELVKELISFIRNTLRVKPSINCYDFYLLSLCKQITDINKEQIDYFFKEMEKDELNPEYLLFKPMLNTSEIQTIKNFLKKNNIQINFKNYQHKKQYNNALVDKILLTDQKLYEPFEGLDLSNMNNSVKEQFDIECNLMIKLKSIDAKFHDVEIIKGEDYYQNLVQKMENDWKVSLMNSFNNYLKSLQNKQKKLNGILLIHYMTVMEPEVYVNAMLEEIRKCATFSEFYSPFSFQLFEALGRKIMSQYLHRSNLLDGSFVDFKNCYKKYVDYTMNPDLIRKYNPREYWQHLMDNGYYYYFDENKCWPSNILEEIGKDLYEIIALETKFNLNIKELMSYSRQPVISFFYKKHERKTKKEVRVNPLLVKIYENAGSDIFFEAERLPMLSPPVPWINPNFGGNLLIRNFLVRVSQNYPKQRLRQTPSQQLYPTFDSLNALSLCPWIINEKILDIAISIFKNSGDMNLDIPISLSRFGPLPRASSDMTSKERAVIYYRRKLQKKEQAEMYSLWADCLYKLSIGNSLRGKYFWFPINTDFRSRVYPIPPNFNHLGNDLSRALLLFGKGKPLGEKGLNWLKIHLINLTGLKKKCSVDERLKYADEIIDLIMDSADNPLTGKKWWMESDEKWQTLACCIELTNALRSADPYSYVSHIPIHQDGSCNGLQHYAALGRDVLGAKSVNLSPSKYPQDVYSDVANLVEDEIEKDLKNGVEIANIVKGFITRKIVKQTVMTYVYGVTKYGAKLQVLKRLKDDSNFPEKHRVIASVYISEKILLSIRKMFSTTRIIQDWLTECAHIISTDYNSTVEWITPLGYPVIQSYYKNRKKITAPLIPNPMKQKNAFPANFIHSLDSSHMMLTSLECHRNGLTFSSVHDCYWTHASDIDKMNYFCRKQFVALHSEPILANLALFLTNKLEQYNKEKPIDDHSYLIQLIGRNIELGEFDLQSVMDSIYFFS